MPLSSKRLSLPLVNRSTEVGPNWLFSVAKRTARLAVAASSMSPGTAMAPPVFARPSMLVPSPARSVLPVNVLDCEPVR